jgi:hypothetical protein
VSLPIISLNIYCIGHRKTPKMLCLRVFGPPRLAPYRNCPHPIEGYNRILLLHYLVVFFPLPNISLASIRWTSLFLPRRWKYSIVFFQCGAGCWIGTKSEIMNQHLGGNGKHFCREGFFAERENIFSKSTKAERKGSTLHVLTYLQGQIVRSPKWPDEVCTLEVPNSAQIDHIEKRKKCLESGISRASIWHYSICQNHLS